MIDLHLHLDGSLSEQDFLYLAKKDGVDLGKDFPNNIYVPADCPSLEVYLERFALPLLLLQSKENISYVTYSLVKRLYDMGYIYAEIRFAPQLHMDKGLTQMDAAEAALEGLNKALKECPEFEANLILCCMSPFDDLLRLGRDVFPVCSDDAHIEPDLFGGWTTVKADALDYDAVIAALLAGNFYSSTGPEIRELYVEDGVLTLKTDETGRVRVVSDWRSYSAARSIFPVREGEDFVARFPIGRLLDKYRAESDSGWQDSYFRLEIEGQNGTHAYTRAFRAREFSVFL